VGFAAMFTAGENPERNQIYIDSARSVRGVRRIEGVSLEDKSKRNELEPV
jgi:hypothetical protein